MSIYNGDIIGFDACSGIPGSTDDDANYHISRVINDREQISILRIVTKVEKLYLKLKPDINVSFNVFLLHILHMM